MRDFLIHAYFSTDLSIIWDTATQDIPALSAYLAPHVTSLLTERVENTDNPPEEI